MHTSSDDELRLLRERAYGPGADIHGDGEAIARLRLLEKRRVDAETGDDAENRDDAKTEDEAAAPAERVHEALLPLFDGAPVLDTASKTAAADARPRRQWRAVAAWLASIVLTVAATAFVSNVTMQAAHNNPLDGGAPQIASLAEDESWEAPLFFSGGRAEPPQNFEEFYGMRVLVSQDAYAPGVVGTCLTVVDKVDADNAGVDSFSGNMFYGCGANEFSPVVIVTVTSDMSREMLDEFGVGAALQFVFDAAGGDVVVFSSAASAVSSSSAQ